MKALIVLFALVASASHAQTLTGKQFDALSHGTTMHFSESDEFYGSEQFFSNQRTVWRAEDGSCINGKWTYEAPAICFVYDDGSGPFCWMIEGDAQDMTVTSTRREAGAPPLVLELSRQDKQPVLCTGPLFGVAFRP